ncbi:MAG: alpha/beta hydrolase [Pseudomonadota bacterium]
MRFLLRLILIGAAVLTMGYGASTAYLFANQDRLIFQTPGTDANEDAILDAMPGSLRVSFKTSDGQVLAGWYRAPQVAGQPVFIFFHGNIGGLDRAKWRWKRVFERGAGVFAFSYRGYPGSTGRPSEDGLHEDAGAAYRWVREKHPADEIVLHGLSLGSGVAAKLATEVDAQALILEAAYTAVSDVAAERYTWLPVQTLLGDRFPTRDIIGDVRMPVLIAHGTDDSVIPFAHAKRLFARAPEPKVLVEIAGGDHSTLVRDGLYGHVWAFLKKLNP